MKKIIYFFFILFSANSFAQTQTVTQSVPFSTAGQSMWGNGGGFSLNVNKEIFKINPAVHFNSGNGSISSLGGYDFGMAMKVDFWMDIGSNFKIEGLTLGEVDVNYPIVVNLDMPAANSFDKGDTVVITTGYTLDPNWDLTTRYPTGGKTSLDLHFGFGLDVELTMCAFGCTTIPIIPNLQLPVQTIDLFAIQTTPTVSATYPCTTVSPCGGGLPACIPSICHTNVLPVIVPDNGLGIGGKFNLPLVVTTDSYDPATKCVNANGGDDYMTLTLDVFAFLDNFASRIPPPAGTAISTVLGNLSNSFSLPFGASLDYTIFEAQFNVANTNTQDFSFCPKVLSHFDFPVPVHYFVTDPAGGNAILSSGYGQTVAFNLGENINFKYPCNYEFLDITPTYSISNTNNFSNHTYDVISFNFAMQALEFNFTMPDIEVIPEICIPEICVELCYPNPSWSKPFNWDCDDVCTPAFCTPSLVFPGFSIGFGPLVDDIIPLGTLPPINYFNDSWSLGGFNPQTMPSFQLIPRDYHADLTGIDVACKGDTTGEATVTITNGRAPYTYVWDNLTTVTTNSTTQTLTGLEANTHYVVVTNANGCVTMDNVALFEPASYLTIPAASIVDVSCNAGNSGQITVTPQGGTSGYTYNWLPTGGSTSTASNLLAGTYTVTVADAHGCYTNRAITIMEPTALVSNLTSQNVSCNSGSDGSVNLTVTGGTVPYSYSWNDGTVSEDLNSIPAGTYNATITDSKGCATNNSAVITEAAASVAISLNSVSNVSCKHGSNGAIDVFASGGAPPYKYQWVNGAYVVLSSVTNIVTSLPADTYQITVTDANGCSKNATYTITEPLQTLMANSSNTEVSCFGGNDGAIILIVTGGTSAYTFNWSNGSTTQNLSSVNRGLYAVTVTDVNGCNTEHSVTVKEPLAGMSSSISPTHILCNGGETGVATLSIAGGTPPYTYAWSNGAISQNLNTISAGSYSVSITDVKGCIQTSSTVLDQPSAALSLAAAIINVSCFGGSNGAADIFVAGGTSPYYYRWSNSDSVILSTALQDLTNLSADAYSLIVTDANGCTERINSLISEPLAPIAISLTPSTVNCFGGNNGTVTSAVTGGTMPYTYNWNNGATTSNLSLLTAGQNTLTVTDDMGCVAQSTTTITEPTVAVTGNTVAYNIKCVGGTEGIGDLFVSGGTPPYTYLWSNGIVTQDLHNVPKGVYSVTITDANGCIATSGVSITEPASSLAVTTVVDSVSCNGLSDGNVSVSIIGGTLPYEIEWGGSIFLMNNIMNKQQIDGLEAGNYLVRVFDGNGCMATQAVTVNEPQPLNLGHTSTPVSCYDGSNGTITISVSGGTAPYTCSWSNATSTQNQTGLTSGYYNVSITDANACRLNGPHYEISQPLAVSIMFTVTEISCKDEHDGSIAAEAFGGVGGFNYSWSNGSNDSQIDKLSAEVYILSTSDGNGCRRSDSVQIAPSTNNCVEIANTFTPNGDGKNDTWIIKNIWLYPNAAVKVFNEWGNLLFDSNGYVYPWDGLYQGNPLPSSTYFFIIDLKNGEPAYTGSITIVR